MTESSPQSTQLPPVPADYHPMKVVSPRDVLGSIEGEPQAPDVIDYARSSTMPEGFTRVGETSPQTETVDRQVESMLPQQQEGIVGTRAFARERFSGLRRVWQSVKQGAKSVADRFAVERDGYRYSVKENLKARMLGSAAMLLTLPDELERRANANYANSNPQQYAARYGEAARRQAAAPMISMREAAVRHVGAQSEAKKKHDQDKRRSSRTRDPFSMN